MSTLFYTSILQPPNSCYHTGVESVILSEDFGEISVDVYKDHRGNHRVVLKEAGEAVSGALFDDDGECMVRYTKESHQGKHLSKQLFAWVGWKFPKNKFRHSEYLTEAGEGSL